MAKLRTILKVEQRSPKFIVTLAIMGIIFFYIAAWILDHFIDMGNYSIIVQQSMFLFMIALPIIFSYYLIDKPPHFTFWEVTVILLVFSFNFILLAFIAPRVLPEIFQQPAAILGSTMNSMLGLP
jgi:hypothetical protein